MVVCGLLTALKWYNKTANLWENIDVARVAPERQKSLSACQSYRIGTQKGYVIMKVLVACEESQRVCIEFRKLGHEAYSCDIEPCSGGHREWHIQDDVLPILNGNCEFQTVDGAVHRIDGKWDMIIAFPPCTYLTVAGNRWFDVEKYGDKAIERERNREQGKQFFMRFVNADCNKIAIENPIGIMNTAYRKPDCIIQPWQFGHNASKSTCLWLKNLDVLKPTDIIQDKQKRKENQQISSDGKLLGFMTRDSNGKIMRYNDPETAKIRSKTFLGIAKAMAEQWGAGKPTKHYEQITIFDYLQYRSLETTI